MEIYWRTKPQGIVLLKRLCRAICIPMLKLLAAHLICGLDRARPKLERARVCGAGPCEEPYSVRLIGVNKKVVEVRLDICKRNPVFLAKSVLRELAKRVATARSPCQTFLKRWCELPHITKVNPKTTLTLCAFSLSPDMQRPKCTVLHDKPKLPASDLLSSQSNL